MGKQYTAEQKDAQRRRNREADNRRKALIRTLKDTECVDCGVKYHPDVMEFHHRNPAEKELSIARGYHYSRAALLAEIAKCDILCANCHRMRHVQAASDAPGAVL